MSLIDDFNTALVQSKELTKRPSNEELLNLYALYKQATEGDSSQERPQGFDFKAIAKHDAWVLIKGKTKDEAMREYAELVAILHKQYT